MSPRWLHWPAAAAGSDWNTNTDGIASQITDSASWAIFTWAIETPTDTEAANLSATNRFVGDVSPYSGTNYFVLASTSTSSVAPSLATHVAVWDNTATDWYVLEYIGVENVVKSGGNIKRWAWNIDTMESRSTTADNTSWATTNDIRVVLLTSYSSGDVIGWSDYS